MSDLKNVPRAPATLQMSYVDYQQTSIYGVNVYTFYVRCNQYYPLPIEANVRLPSELAKPYISMRETLVKEPHMFFFKNGGINVIANNVKIDKSKNKVTLDFKENYGVLNGGHTQQAIIDARDSEDYIDDTAIVRVEVLEWRDRTDDDLALLAAAKNLSSNVKPTSIANKRGYFDTLKKCLDGKYEKNIEWIENEEIDGDKFSSTKLIALLTLFDGENFSSRDHPLAAANASGSVFKSWIKSCDEGTPKLTKVFPLVNDILDLYEHICSTFNKNLGLGFVIRKQIKNVQDKDKHTPFTRQSIDFILPEQVIIPIMSSFRADLEEFDNTYRWVVEPKKLFDIVKKDLFKAVGNFLDKNDINRMSKDPTIWENLYMKVQLEVINAKRS